MEARHVQRARTRERREQLPALREHAVEHARGGARIQRGRRRQLADEARRDVARVGVVAHVVEEVEEALVVGHLARRLRLHEEVGRLRRRRRERARADLGQRVERAERDARDEVAPVRVYLVALRDVLDDAVGERLRARAEGELVLGRGVDVQVVREVAERRKVLLGVVPAVVVVLGVVLLRPRLDLLVDISALLRT